MKRYRFSQYDGVDLIAPCFPLDVSKPDSSPADEVLKLVYLNDPITGRPRSDLGTYLSDNTNPLVRDFIERQLRTDFSGNVGAVPDGISDFDISYLTRDVHESESDYVHRVSKYFATQKLRYQEAVRVDEQKNVVEPKTESL